MRKQYCNRCKTRSTCVDVEQCPKVSAELYALEHGPKHRRKKRIDLVYFHQLEPNLARLLESRLYGDTNIKYETE